MIDREALADLCENWPANGMQFESRTGKWNSSITGIALFPVDRTTVNLRFDLLPTDRSWPGPTQRNLILHISGFSFDRGGQYVRLLNETVLDFLDSESLSGEKQVLSPATNGGDETSEFA